MTAPRLRALVGRLRDDFSASQRRVCRALGAPRSVARYEPRRDPAGADLERRVEELAALHPRYGYRRVHALLRREGRAVNEKAVRRLWRSAGLKLPRPGRRPGRPRPAGAGEAGCRARPPRGRDDVWALDFVFARTADGRGLKILSVIDEYTRECIFLDAGRSMTADDVRAALAAVVARRGGGPTAVRSDNGPEFAAGATRAFLEGAGLRALLVAPASPWQNGYVEAFHGRLRDELLDREEFADLAQARALLEAWRVEYNTARPHGSLGYRTPAEFAAITPRYAPVEEADEATDAPSVQTNPGLPL